MLKFFIFASFYVICAYSWVEWNYTVQWWVKGGDALATADEVANKQQTWYAVWSNETLYGATKNAPRPRRGHSMVITRTPNIAPFNGHTYILLFGGRDNDNTTSHIPRTYNIQKVNILYKDIPLSYSIVYTPI